MKKIFIALISLCFLSISQEKINVLYKSLKPNSVSAHLAFYQLFPETAAGKKALHDAWKLLSCQSSDSPLTFIPPDSINAIVTLITKAEGVETVTLNQETLNAVHELAKNLPNRKLKGHYAKSEEEVLSLPFQEVDLSRGLLLAQGSETDSYDALIDLMALQILTRISLDSPPKEKIREINRFIFQEMGYRFPPHSVYVKDIDLYTYLPSVIDSRRGVCLGVSILYLALGQRLDLPLEAITPPGHIYVRYPGPHERNIETTARGIHIDSEEYLGLESEHLQTRNIKEVIGLAYFNEASVHWQNQNYNRALQCYKKALLYLPEDPLLLELMGYNYLFIGEKEKGDALIKQIPNSSFDSSAQRSIREDYLNGNADGEAIQILFLHVDEKRESLIHKKTKLEETIAKWPLFRAAHFHLAITHLQLHRMKEALLALNSYLSLEKNDVSAEYLAAELNAIRSDYPAAHDHFSRAKKLISHRLKIPKTLKEFHKQLTNISPE